MLKYLWNRINKNEEGFTLVELLVVIVILGVLMGIGIPTYKGFTKRSHEAATKSELQAISTALKYLEIEAKTLESDIDEAMKQLQSYLGDEDLKKVDDTWVFLENYNLSLPEDSQDGSVKAMSRRDDRLNATVTKGEVEITE